MFISIEQWCVQIATSAVKRIDGLRILDSESQKSDAALDFVMGAVNGVMALGHQDEAMTIIRVLVQPNLGPKFLANMRRVAGVTLQVDQ